jgi:hypothetical protein
MFTGSGAIEGGVKAIVVQRAKQAGMHWTTDGAADIIALMGTWQATADRHQGPEPSSQSAGLPARFMPEPLLPLPMATLRPAGSGAGNAAAGTRAVHPGSVILWPQSRARPQRPCA